MSQQQLNPLEIQALRTTHKAGVAFHEVARKLNNCQPWAFCHCPTATALLEADVVLCKLEYRPNDGGWLTKKAAIEGQAVPDAS